MHFVHDVRDSSEDFERNSITGSGLNPECLIEILAGSGLGLATAKAFAESGASVALADWNEKAASSATAELAAQGHNALAIHCDVADDEQVQAMV